MSRNIAHKALFINPPSIPYTLLLDALRSKADWTQPVSMPMGILYLSAVLLRDFPGIEIKIVDFAKSVQRYFGAFDEKTIELDELFREILNDEIERGFVPDFVGISFLFLTAHKTGCLLSKVVKKRWNQVPVIAGGTHATNGINRLFEDGEIDFVCRGEGEIAVSEFAKVAFSGRLDRVRIQGVVGKDETPSIRGEELARRVEDLDSIPFPAWELLPMKDYVRGPGGRAMRLESNGQAGEASIITTRGCPFACTFCASWTVHGRKVRYRSIENLLEELSILHDRFGVGVITPEDDLFTANKDRILGLNEAVRAKFGNRLQFQFPNALSVATLDEEVIAALVGMGMKVATIAIESGSPHVQKNIMKKNVDLEKAARVTRLCRDLGVVVRAYFMLGFPGETREQMLETVAYSTSLSTDWNVYFIATPLLGTEMYRQFVEEGSIDDSFNCDSESFQERTFDTRGISASELKKITYSANINVNFFGNYNLRHGHFERAISDFRRVLEAYPWHIVAQYCIGLAYKGMGEKEEFKMTLENCRRLLQTSPEARALYAEFSDLFHGPKLRQLSFMEPKDKRWHPIP